MRKLSLFFHKVGVAKGIEAKKDSKFVKEWTRNESAGYVDERDRKVKGQKRKKITMRRKNGQTANREPIRRFLPLQGTQGGS